jgi:hypothetical protein
VDPQFTPEKSTAAKSSVPFWSAIIFLWAGLILARGIFTPAPKEPAASSVASGSQGAEPVGASPRRTLQSANEAVEDFEFTGSADAAPLEPVSAHSTEQKLRVSVQFCTS